MVMKDHVEQTLTGTSVTVLHELAQVSVSEAAHEVFSAACLYSWKMDICTNPRVPHTQMDVSVAPNTAVSLPVMHENPSWTALGGKISGSSRPMLACDSKEPI